MKPAGEYMLTVVAFIHRVCRGLYCHLAHHIAGSSVRKKVLYNEKGAEYRNKFISARCSAWV